LSPLPSPDKGPHRVVRRNWRDLAFSGYCSDGGYKYCSPVVRDGYTSELPPPPGEPETVAPVLRRPIRDERTTKGTRSPRGSERHANTFLPRARGTGALELSRAQPIVRLFPRERPPRLPPETTLKVRPRFLKRFRNSLQSCDWRAAVKQTSPSISLPAVFAKLSQLNAQR
jgi:hypothetical protein